MNVLSVYFMLIIIKFSQPSQWEAKPALSSLYESFRVKNATLCLSIAADLQPFFIHNTASLHVHFCALQLLASDVNLSFHLFPLIYTLLSPGLLHDIQMIFSPP